MSSLGNVFEGKPEAQLTPATGERVSVELDNSNLQEPKLKLRQQSWAEGVGWFTQKTVIVGLEQASTLSNDLQQAIISAKLLRSQPQRQHPLEAVIQADEQRGKVLEFPHSISPAKTSIALDNTSKGILLEFKPRQ